MESITTFTGISGVFVLKTQLYQALHKLSRAIDPVPRETFLRLDFDLGAVGVKTLELR